MKLLLTSGLMALFTLANAASAAPGAVGAQAGISTQIGHGGGCRKSSPPGQCCHMETAVGRVHCH